MRYRSGAALARNDDVTVDMVAGVPDSGTGHSIGYANEARLPQCRPFVKYTPTWARNFTPQDQNVRNVVARMKLIPVYELIRGKRLLFCEDSIVRGTQLRETIERLYDCGAKEVHMRPACPPLIYGCRFLNFSRSRSDLDLAGRQAIREIEGQDEPYVAEYAIPDSPKRRAMIDRIRIRLNLTSLKYQTQDDMLAAINLPRESVHILLGWSRLAVFCVEKYHRGVFAAHKRAAAVSRKEWKGWGTIYLSAWWSFSRCSLVPSKLLSADVNSLSPVN